MAPCSGEVQSFALDDDYGNKLHLHSKMFGRPFVKRFALCYRTVVLSVLTVLSVCPVCNIGISWPNGWMDQDETWHGGRPQPYSHCVRRGPSPQGHSPQSSANVYCVKWSPISATAEHLFLLSCLSLSHLLQ